MPRILSFLLLLLALLATPALAQPYGKLVITVDRPIAVLVDGRMLEFEDGTTSVEMQGLEPGRHIVEFRNAFGKLIDEGVVEVPFEGRSVVRARWAGKSFSVYDTVILDDRPTEVVVVEHHAPVATESVTVSTSLGGFGASATVETSAGGASASVGTSIGGSVTVTESYGTGVVREEVVVTERRAPRLVTFRVTDDESMNLWIDGKRAWAYHVGTAEKVLELPAGEHHVEIKNFMEDATVCAGQLYVDQEITVGISADGCVQVFNDPTAFQRLR